MSIPRPRPAYHATRVDATRAAMTIAASSSYPDGIYTGPVVDAYYGLIQIAAIIQGGQLDDRFLDSNHIRWPRRVCETKCERRAAD